MARRKSSKNIIPFGTLVSIMGVLLGLWVVANVFSKISFNSVGPFIGLALAIGAAIIFIPRLNVARELPIKITHAVNMHAIALARRRAQLLQVDAYGKVEPTQWHKEIDHFLTSQVAPSFSKSEMALLQSGRLKWISLVERLVEEAQNNNPAFGMFSPEMKPSEFEAFCAEELQRIGWDAHVTKAGRDQGVDVVAQKAGIRLVLQCKLYSQPVGNNAVQEVVAAKAHERAHFAAVVSNNRYTAPAQQLANTNGIALLHYSDLRNIDMLISKMHHPKN